MKIGVYADYCRMYLQPEEAKKLFGNSPEGTVFLSIMGSWGEGYILSAHDEPGDGRRKLSKKSPHWSGKFTHFVDYNLPTLGTLPFDRITNTDVKLRFIPNRREIHVKTGEIDLRNHALVDYQPNPAPVEPPATEPVPMVVETDRAEQATVPRRPLPNIPDGLIDLGSFDKVPQSSRGLVAALSLLEDELDKYNVDSLVPLEFDVFEGNIVFRPKRRAA